MTAVDSSVVQPMVGYSATARFWHWLTVALVLTQVALGFVMVNFEIAPPLGDLIYNFHKSLGPVILVVILLRLIYRLGHPAPPLPTDIPAPQRFVANSVHWALYFFLIVQPIVGYVGTSAYPAPVPFFGLFELPKIWPDDRALSDQLFVVHRYIAWALVFLVGMHVAGALYHHFIRKDGVLLRMTRG